MKNKSVDVFFLTSNFDYESFMEPVGICILSAIVQKKGYSTKVLEPSIYAYSWEKCAQIIIEYNPRILAISILIDLNVENVSKLVSKVKERCPQTQVIIGGQACTMNYKQKLFMDLFENIELFMYGESEKVIGELIEKMLGKENWTNLRGIGYKKDGVLTINPPAPREEDLNKIPFMDRSVLADIKKDHPQYKETSVPYGRGCNCSCSFCSEGFFRGKNEIRVRRRTLDSVFEEIKYLYYTYGIRSFNIEDESFLEKDLNERAKIIKFCNKIKTLPEKVSLKLLGRIDCVEEDSCRALFEAGTSYMFLGVDSFVEKDLKLFNKGYSPEIVTEKLNLLLKIGYSLQVESEHRVSTGYITWHPYTTLDSLRKSLDFFMLYNNTPKLIEHKLMVFESTPLKQKIASDGLLLRNYLLKGEYEYPWKFQSNLIEMLYNSMKSYFDEWSPIRDGIRMLEKYATMEDKKLGTEISLLVERRRKLDKQFYDFFDELLISAENGKSESMFNEITESHLQILSQTLNNEDFLSIDKLCKKIGFQSNIIDGIRNKSLWLCRYRN